MSQVYADYAQGAWHNAHYAQPHQFFDPPADARQPAPGLSLNLSCLSVASPTNISPINPPASSLLSPASPLSPGPGPFGQPTPSPFQFDPHQGSPGQQSPATHYDDQGLAPPGSAAGSYDRRAPSRSSSSSAASSQLPRKRSFPSSASSASLSTTLVEESPYDESREAAMVLSSYDDLDMRTAYGSSTNGGGSPVDGSGNTSGAEDALNSNGSQMSMGLGGVGGSMNVLGKPMATNNFVTKLYQMINDAKSAHFIAWTELGTSFVVSNVGEFSRSILGSHFKHNNFSSFVRQLNMYGFHKINRTPRAQRTSTDAQTWEFSHHKFLRGRPDLLDEIKRKALEPDPAIKHRVELPGEVAAQLTAMRDENRRMQDQLTTERQRVDKLVNVVGRLWDVMNKSFPSIGQFPPDLLESDSPNIFITSPTATTSRYPPPLSMNLSNPSLHTMHSLNSPGSSPTAADFPSQLHGQQHPLSRQHSFQHLTYRNGEQGNNGTSTSTPLPGSPGSGHMDLFDDVCDSGRGNSLKRPRLDPSASASNNGGMQHNNASVDSLHLMSTMSSPGTATGPGLGAGLSKKNVSRARSDSAPLGYGHMGGSMNGAWGNGMGVHNAGVGGVSGRPRSGSGMGPRIPNIGSMTRNNVSTPLLSITTIPQ